MYWLDPNLQKFEQRVHSQLTEDGVIEKIIETLRIQNGYYVEFGVGPRVAGSLEMHGIEANTRLLREKGWLGLWMDGQDHPSHYQVQKEFITALNINLLLSKYKVPRDFDLISIDIDGQDLWVWMALNASPKIVIIECNGNFDFGDSRSIPFNVDHRWDGTTYFGASVTALQKMGRSKGYVNVWCNAINCIFVREDLLQNPESFEPERIHKKLPRRIHRIDEQNRSWVVI